MGKYQREKGAAFERLIANTLTQETGVVWKRGLGQTRGGGAEASDVISDLVPSIHIECKNHKITNIKAAYRQAVGDAAAKQKVPVVITKDARSDTLVTMKLEDWIPLLKLYLKDMGL